jgi:hypothetical protein
MSPLRFAVVCAGVATLASSGLAQQPVSVTVGPWSIATTYEAEKSRELHDDAAASGVGVEFIRNGDGLFLNLDSSK